MSIHWCYPLRKQHDSRVNVAKCSDIVVVTSERACGVYVLLVYLQVSATLHFLLQLVVDLVQVSLQVPVRHANHHISQDVNRTVTIGFRLHVHTINSLY